MTEREKLYKLYILVLTEPLRKADAIILLAGDGNARVSHAANLYRQKWAPKIIVSGGPMDRNYGSFPPKILARRLAKEGVEKKNTILDEKSNNTREQAVNIIGLAKSNKWKKIILVASPHHQLRAFLTFLKATQETGMKLQLINSPAQNLPWFEKNRWGKRIDWLEPEFKKIVKYKKHMADFSEAILHQKIKEKKHA